MDISWANFIQNFNKSLQYSTKFTVFNKVYNIQQSYSWCKTFSFNKIQLIFDKSFQVILKIFTLNLSDFYRIQWEIRIFKTLCKSLWYFIKQTKFSWYHTLLLFTWLLLLELESWSHHFSFIQADSKFWSFIQLIRKFEVSNLAMATVKSQYLRYLDTIVIYNHNLLFILGFEL